MTVLHMLSVMIFSFFFVGERFRRSFEGGSVARAKAAKESMIMLSQSISIAFKGDSLMMNPQRMATAMATKLTVSWN